jgi:hypothetical protein
MRAGKLIRTPRRSPWLAVALAKAARRKLRQVFKSKN